ncbi:uncharacterized protein LOC117325897 [Pecten maximus]|uniref:uncharacterized protein LOC117325897 n=1 Tax=Pecten maximus TaxID=6579 RepID=UPI00145804A3|nr:uncharacterized protein LOC117325897 [Pecten maximus]
MATTQESVSLQNFKGSEEEETAKHFLEIITTETESPVPSFLNLVIHNSNALAGKSFSDAWVHLQLSHEIEKTLDKKYSRYPKVGLIYIKDIINVSVLEEFKKGGVDVVENYPDDCRLPFLTLLEFLREKKKHEEAIQKIVTQASLLTSGNKETHIMAGFAHHLFSQLVPGKVYEVDKYAEQLPKECGCGCKAKISAGDTSVGSKRTWHGRVDTMVNRTVAVVFGKKQTDDFQEIEDDESDNDEPQRKQRKVETDKNCDIVGEYKRRHQCVLLDSKVLEQVLAEAITNGFAQVNRNKSALSGFFIPTIGTTSDHVSICLYDPESDCLLHIREEYKLWYPGSKYKLNELTIIVIWLFLNFTVLTRRKLADAFGLNIDKSGLHADLKENLVYYREVKTEENFVSQAPVQSPWKYVHAHPIKPAEPSLRET